MLTEWWRRLVVRVMGPPPCGSCQAHADCNIYFMRCSENGNRCGGYAKRLDHYMQSGEHV